MHSQSVIFVRLYVKMCLMKGQVVHDDGVNASASHLFYGVVPRDIKPFLRFAESDLVCPEETTHKAQQSHGSPVLVTG